MIDGTRYSVVATGMHERENVIIRLNFCRRGKCERMIAGMMKKARKRSVRTLRPPIVTRGTKDSRQAAKEWLAKIIVQGSSGG